MKTMIKFIVSYIISQVKKFLFEIKKNKINKEINKLRKDMKDEAKTMVRNVNDFEQLSKLFDKQQKDKVRDSLRIVRSSGEVSEKGDKDSK